MSAKSLPSMYSQDVGEESCLGGGGGKKAKKPGAERGLPQNLLGRGRCLEWTGNGETG